MLSMLSYLFNLGRSLVSGLWWQYLGVKHQLFGLSPLQSLVYKHCDKKTEDPLWTYWLLLTYEAEIFEAISKAKEDAMKSYRESCTDKEINEATQTRLANAAEKEAYSKICNALRACINSTDKNNNTDNNIFQPNAAKHNIKKRIFLHLFGLTLVGILMVGIAASNTITLVSFVEENMFKFGSYSNLFTAFFYSASMWAQWMIFRKGVTKMLKSFLSGSRWTDDLELAEEEEGYQLRYKRKKQSNIKDSELPNYWYRRIKIFFYGVCTAVCSTVWGVFVFSKLSGNFSDPQGYFALSANLSTELALLFGALSGFSAFFLWFTTLRKEIKEEEQKEREEAELRQGNQLAINSPQTPAENPGRSWVLKLMIAATLYALFASMLGQSRVTFETLGWENANGNPLDPKHPTGLTYFCFIVGAAFLGRMPFTIKAIEGLYTKIKATWEATTLKKIDLELFEYRSNYVLGGLIMLTLLSVFTASLFEEQMRKPLTEGNNGHRILSPMGIMAIGAIFVWTIFLIFKRFRDGSPEEADIKEAKRAEKTAWFPSGTLKKGSETRTGEQAFASALNGLGFGAIGGAATHDSFGDVAEASDSEKESWVEPTAAIFTAGSQLTLAMQSFSTSTAQMVVDKEGYAERLKRASEG